MIILDISPEVIKNNQLPNLDLRSEEGSDDSDTKMIVHHSDSGTILGWAKQTENPRHTVRFFQGKGGFCAIVAGQGAIYFGLPGSKITLPDTVVELPGNPIVGRDKTEVPAQTHTPSQTVTTQAMILGAGLATRFEPISGDTTGFPKPGVPLAGGDSVIVCIAKLLQKHGFKRILVNTFYKPERMKAQLQAIPGVEIVFIDEDAPSGTAGGLLKAMQQGLVDETKPIVIIQGDAVTDADLSFLMQAHEERKAAVTIGGQIVPDKDVSKFGIIETDAVGQDGQSGHIVSFKEKPSLEDAGPCRFGNTGFYVLGPESYPLFRQTGETCFAQGKLFDYAQDFFPAVLSAVGQGQVKQAGTDEPLQFWAQAMGGYWSDIGNPTQYIESVRDLYGDLSGIDMPENRAEFYENGIIYWPGAKALAQQAGAQLQGNVIVARQPE